MPRVWNIRDPNCPKDAVYIGRAVPCYQREASIWANPYKLRSGADNLERQRCVEQYRHYLLANIILLSGIFELRGKDLVCWCAPLPCHGDVLLGLANGTGDSENDH